MDELVVHNKPHLYAQTMHSCGAHKQQKSNVLLILVYIDVCIMYIYQETLYSVYEDMFHDSTEVVEVRAIISNCLKGSLVHKTLYTHSKRNISHNSLYMTYELAM